MTMDKSYISDGNIMVQKNNVLHSIPISALGTWSALLGYTNALDCLDAQMRVGQDLTEPEDGDNPWDDVFAVQKHLETVREEAAELVEEEAKRASGPERDPRSPRLRAAFTVKDELDRISGGPCSPKDSLLAKCQQATRDILRVPDPESPPTVVRSRQIMCDPKPQCVDPGGKPHLLGPPEREELMDVLDSCDTECDEDCAGSHLEERMEWVNRRRLIYLHQLTGRGKDPLEFEYAEKEAKPRRATLNTVLSKYQVAGEFAEAHAGL